jgi:hypothetical protein
LHSVPMLPTRSISLTLWNWIINIRRTT